MSGLVPSDRQPPRRKSVPLFDVEVTPLTAEEVVDLVLQSIAASQGLVVANLNLHGVYMFHTDKHFARFCELSDVVLIDGAPVAWAASQPMSTRVGSTDWIDALMPRASNLRILAVGGTMEASAAAERHMREHFPAALWVGIDGFSSHQVDEKLKMEIARADLILVGMGMPTQERWINNNRELFRSKVVANVGGCFDYYAGVQHLAPRWTGPLGVEWLYRLVRNPYRLANRYLIEPFRLAWVLIRIKTARALRAKSNNARDK